MSSMYTVTGRYVTLSCNHLSNYAVTFLGRSRASYPVPAPAGEAELNGGRRRGLVHQILKIITAVREGHKKEQTERELMSESFQRIKSIRKINKISAIILSSYLR